MNYDAVVVGSGPNGLAAAITLAQCGYKIKVFEAASDFGGGCRTSELTLPGFRHDVCSSVYPMIPLSPFFKELAAKGIQPELIEPDIPVVHVFDNDRSVSIEKDIEHTILGLGKDRKQYERLIGPFLTETDSLFEDLLAPPLQLRNPIPLLRFGWRGFRSAESLANKWFTEETTQGMFAGMAAHSMLPIDRWLTGAIGMMFCIAAHSSGWPIAKGGAQSISRLLAGYLESLGGKIETDCRITSLDELPDSKVVLFDTTPSLMLQIAGDALPANYQRRLRKFKHGPGVCKVDWALDSPIPWRSESCKRAGTVHIGGSLSTIAKNELAVWNNQIPAEPFVLVTQPSLFDDTRAPAGKHVAWAYCHVPNGYTVDMSDAIERQIEKAAPGFQSKILGRHVLTAPELQRYNVNFIGGDISGGAMNMWQFLARPVFKMDPYSTPNSRIFLCSASTPPGPGVHGMCGYHAARSVMASPVLKQV